MKIDKHVFSAAVCSVFAFAMCTGARADTVVQTHPLDGTNEVYIRLNNALQANIYDQYQGNVCHGINVTSYNPYNANGTQIDTIDSDISRTAYFFTGPTCDGFVHIAHPGQRVLISNSNNTSHIIWVKSYYFK